MYLKKINRTILGLLIFIFACQSTENAVHDSSLHGEWMMHAVIQQGNDVTAEHNPEKDRYIIFKEDGTFESGGSPWGKNTGKFTFNETDKSLFLDSDVGEEDDSNWEVNFQGDTLQWQGVGTAWAEDFQIIHVKR